MKINLLLLLAGLLIVAGHVTLTNEFVFNLMYKVWWVVGLIQLVRMARAFSLEIKHYAALPH